MEPTHVALGGLKLCLQWSLSLPQHRGVLLRCLELGLYKGALARFLLREVVQLRLQPAALTAGSLGLCPRRPGPFSGRFQLLPANRWKRCENCAGGRCGGTQRMLGGQGMTLYRICTCMLSLGTHCIWSCPPVSSSALRCAEPASTLRDLFSSRRRAAESCAVPRARRSS